MPRVTRTLRLSDARRLEVYKRFKCAKKSLIELKELSASCVQAQQQYQALLADGKKDTGALSWWMAQKMEFERGHMLLHDQLIAIYCDRRRWTVLSINIGELNTMERALD